MSVPPRYIAAAWGSVATYACYSVNKHIQRYEDRNPCVQPALRHLATSPAASKLLGGQDLRVAWWPRRGMVDKISGLASASFEVSGSAGTALVMVASRRRQTGSDRDGSEDEDVEIDRDSWWFYFFSPWEVKRAIVDTVKGFSGSLQPAPAAEDEILWDIDSVCLLPSGGRVVGDVVIVAGNPNGLPDYEQLRSDDAASKGERSQQQLRVACSIAMGGAALAACMRFRKTLGASSSYAFAKRCVLAHPAVAKAVPGATVQTQSGTFRSRYICAQLRLVGRDSADKTTVADVDFAASRDGVRGGPWRVARAQLTVGGRLFELDKYCFCTT